MFFPLTTSIPVTLKTSLHTIAHSWARSQSSTKLPKCPRRHSRRHAPQRRLSWLHGLSLSIRNLHLVQHVYSQRWRTSHRVLQCSPYTQTILTDPESMRHTPTPAIEAIPPCHSRSRDKAYVLRTPICICKTISLNSPSRPPSSLSNS